MSIERIDSQLLHDIAEVDYDTVIDNLAVDNFPKVM